MLQYVQKSKRVLVVVGQCLNIICRKPKCFHPSDLKLNVLQFYKLIPDSLSPLIAFATFTPPLDLWDNGHGWPESSCSHHFTLKSFTFLV